MSAFINLDGPTFDLQSELNRLLEHGSLEWYRDQICLTTTEDQPLNYKLGVGSLYHNWETAQKKIDEGGNITYDVNMDSSRLLREPDFTINCKQIEGTQFEEAINWLRSRFSTVHRVRLMRMHPNHCLSWHTDSSPRVHYPITTDEGARMMVQDEGKHMPKDTWWLVDTTVHHTAFNGSKQSRIHLVACIGK